MTTWAIKVLLSATGEKGRSRTAQGKAVDGVMARSEIGTGVRDERMYLEKVEEVGCAGIDGCEASLAEGKFRAKAVADQKKLQICNQWSYVL